MAEAEAARVARLFRERLLSQDRAAAARLVNAYGPIWRSIQPQIEAIAANAIARGFGAEEILRDTRFRALERQILAEMARYSRAANGVIAESQRQSIALSLQASQLTVEAALPEGVTLDSLGRIGVHWNRLHAPAFENQISEVIGHSASP